LPLDTSIAALRKSPKNVRMMISRELRQQMSRVRDAKKVLEGKLADEQAIDLGVICSFSIPIITIAALMALMIIIGLLNIVFFWMPFLRICLPIPLKSKT
jgi:hypothetical protein